MIGAVDRGAVGNKGKQRDIYTAGSGGFLVVNKKLFRRDRQWLRWGKQLHTGYTSYTLAFR